MNKHPLRFGLTMLILVLAVAFWVDYKKAQYQTEIEQYRSETVRMNAEMNAAEPAEDPEDVQFRQVLFDVTESLNKQLNLLHAAGIVPETPCGSTQTCCLDEPRGTLKDNGARSDIHGKELTLQEFEDSQYVVTDNDLQFSHCCPKVTTPPAKDQPPKPPAKKPNRPKTKPGLTGHGAIT